MPHHPTIREDHTSVVMEFAPPPKRSRPLALKMVLDFSRRGELVGIEIINLILQTGPQSLDLMSRSLPRDGHGMRYAYDKDSDSFYMRVRASDSVSQQSVHGSVLIDDEGRIGSLAVKW
jgi:uncharacterized protein YuzE